MCHNIFNGVDMNRDIGKIERKSRNGSVGSFFFGALIGLLFGIAAIAGIVALFYYKASPNWINDKFHTELDLGNDDLNNLTLNKFVTHAINLSQNIDSYTLNDLQSDFDIEIKDEIVGINITDLKDVPLPKLVDALQNKLSNISAEELKNVIDMTEIDSILNETNTYYFNMVDMKLYKDADFNEAVEFDYSIDLARSRVIIKDYDFPLSSNQVKVALRYIPLNEAISSISVHIDSKITIGELRDEYNIALPAFFDNISDSTQISGLGQAIEGLTVAQLLTYEDQDSDGIYEDKNGNEVSKLMNKLADFKIGELSESVTNLKISDIFASEELSVGALSLIDDGVALTNLAQTLSTAFEESSMDELINAGLIEPSARYYSSMGGTIDDGTGIKDKYINVGSTDSPEYKQVKDLILSDFSNLMEILEDSGVLLDEIPSA